MMGLFAAIVGSLGGLCGAMGVVTAFDVGLDIGDQFTVTFWFSLAVILLLGSIAMLLGRGSGGGDYD
jgi:hypothetical protein